MQNARSGLHPLLTAAAISITVFSAVGVASLTGLIPSSLGSQKEAVEAVAPPEPAAPVLPAPKAVEAPKAKPKVAVKPAVRESVAKPVAPAGIVATVEEVREVTTPGEHTALGPIAGGVTGAVVGSQFGKGNGRKVLTVLGALGGALAGKHIEKQARGDKHWETTVRLADGSQRTVQTPMQPAWTAGERVRYLDGRLLPV